MRPGRRLLVLAAAFVLAACASSAAPSVNGAWARAASAEGVSAAYLTIVNGSAASDTLLSASSAAARMVQVHETTTDASGSLGMRPVGRVDIPAGGSVEFAPGGRHIMLMGLVHALAPGDTLELRLVFEHAGTVVVSAPVRSS